MMLFSLSPVSSPSWTAIVTDPDKSLTRHVPQVPTRQELSISTPTASATSRTVRSRGSGAALCDRANVTVGRATALPATTAGGDEGRAGVGSGRPRAAPNASVLTRFAGTPSSANSFLTASIIGTGPHRWTYRLATSGTDLAISSLVIRPEGPAQSVPSGWVTVTTALTFGWRRCRCS